MLCLRYRAGSNPLRKIERFSNFRIIILKMCDVFFVMNFIDGMYVVYFWSLFTCCELWFDVFIMNLQNNIIFSYDLWHLPNLQNIIYYDIAKSE